MARTPTGVASELESLIGTRGVSKIDSSNRALVQKWLTCNGVKAEKAKSLSLDDLNRTYNDLDNTFLDRLHLEGLRPSSFPAGSPPMLPPPLPPPLPSPDIQTALAMLTQAITSSQQSPSLGALTEERVRELIGEHIQRPTHVVLKDITRALPAGEHKHRIFDKVLRSVVCGNVALIGAAGSGKTTIAEQVSRVLGVPFYFCGAINSEYKLTGFIDAQGRVVRTAFREAFENGGLFLFDEIDGSSPNAVLAFNAALANGHADFPDKAVPKHKDFYCLAAANTYWTGQDRVYVGRNQLDGATLDRFIFIDMDYDTSLERKIAGNDAWVEKVISLRKAAKELKIRHIISPRASIMGAKLLAQGLSEHDVLESVVFKGLDRDSINKISVKA